MRESESVSLVPSTEIDGSLQHRRKFSSKDGRCLFGECAKLAWGPKPDTFIAQLAGVTDRAARDYISGKAPVPAIVAATLLVEIIRRR